MTYTIQYHPASHPPQKIPAHLAEEGRNINVKYQHVVQELPMLPAFQVVLQESYIHGLEKLAARIRQHDGLVVFGTGGSSLGGRTLCALSDGLFPVEFVDNADPHTLGTLLARAQQQKLFFLIISKSGNTVETLVQASLLIEQFKAHKKIDTIGQHTAIITTKHDSPLQNMAEEYAIPAYPHDPDIGGRYSVFSLVGMVPAMAAGLDVRKIHEGAASVLRSFTSSVEHSAVAGAFWQTISPEYRPMTVLIPYADRLQHIAAWWQQLWAESLGKDGKGSTPLRALGSVDQHSQLQLWMDGPKDKQFTFLTLEEKDPSLTLKTAPKGMEYLQGHGPSAVMAALAHGTRETVKKIAPLREISLPQLNEFGMGAIMMHLMLETITGAEFLGVDAFNQPGVEQGKILARDYLKAHKA